MIAFNSMTKTFQSSWVDDFHMNYAIVQDTHGLPVVLELKEID